MRLLASLCLTSGLLFVPIVSLAMGGGPVENQYLYCDRIDYGQGDTLNPIQVDPHSVKDCSVPVGEAVVTNPSTSAVWRYWHDQQEVQSTDQLQNGDYCEGSYLAGPTFVRQGDLWQVSWKDPANVVHEGYAPVQPQTIEGRKHLLGQVPGHLDAVAPFLGFNLVQIQMRYLGQWQTRSGQGQCVGNWRPGRQVHREPQGYGSDDANPEVQLTPYVPAPPGGPVTVVPREPIQRILRDPGTLSAGQIAMAPRADRGLVNLDQHAWIEGATVQSQSVWEIVRDSLPDPTGRGLRYQYYVTVGLSGVDWTWGDGSGTSWWQDLGEPGPTGRNPTHRYTTLSARLGTGPAVNGTASYLVQAVEHYTVDVVAVWFDGRGNRRQDLGDLGLGFDQSPPPVGLYVGQLEGVPFG